ncbi:MAG: hypothetical protein KC457_33225, partial [Myxococcales bacterium]|nr:hypothetical protein [Myxococcales bacterium]
MVRQWERFAANPEVRLLHWLFRQDELRMLEAFLAIEDDENGELPELFVTLDQPFESLSAGYGHELRHALEVHFAALAPLRGELGLPPWRAPGSSMARSDIGSLVEFCAEAATQLGAGLEHLVLVLWPREVGKPDDYAAWLRRAAQVAPEEVRLRVVDRAEAPLLTSLAASGPVCRVVAELDMGGALTQLVAEAPVAPGGDPGARFREAQVAMALALAGGDTGAAREHAETAESFARATKLPYLEVVVPFSLATGLLAAGELEPALQQFSRAESLAEQASTVDDQTDAAGEDIIGDWAAPLHVEARLGLAATLVAMGAWRHAAESYLAAAALARAIPDPRTEFESLRM